jgi:hypothetical protein
MVLWTVRLSAKNAVAGLSSGEVVLSWVWMASRDFIKEIVVNGKLKSEKVKRDWLICIQFRDIHLVQFVEEGPSRGPRGKG